MRPETPSINPPSPDRQLSADAMERVTERMHAERSLKELEHAYRHDRAFNPVVALRIEKMKHEREISRLEARQAADLSRKLRAGGGAAESAADTAASGAPDIGEQLARHRGLADWFGRTADAAERGDVAPAQEYLASFESRIATNLQDALADEQAARAAVEAAWNDPARLKMEAERYADVAKELRIQQDGMKRYLDQKKYLELLKQSVS